MNYEYFATDRTSSIFKPDINEQSQKLNEAYNKARICVIGGAGSIGAAVVKALLDYQPDTLSIIDINENALSDLVRDIRSNPEITPPRVIEAIAIGLGSAEFNHYIADSEPFDYFFNLSAMKHVRSEKNIYSLKRMVDTNIVFLDDFLKNLPYKPKKFFSVSSDKAVNPGNLMGASKNMMEQALNNHSDKMQVSSARFANVAFSLGSLPHAFLKRIENKEPLAAPSDVRRFFISHQEAAELCLLSAAVGKNQEIYFPNLKSGVQEKQFSKIAEDLLNSLGYEPVLCKTEEEAKSRASELIAQKKWPCLFQPSNTTGEKQYEEFFGETDSVDLERHRTVGITTNSWDSSKQKSFNDFLLFAKSAKLESCDKKDYVDKIKLCVPGLTHQELGKSLDEKM